MGISPGDHTVEYADPVRTVDGTEVGGPERRAHTVETIRISLPPMESYLHHLAAQGLLVLNHLQDVPQP